MKSIYGSIVDVNRYFLLYGIVGYLLSLFLLCQHPPLKGVLKYMADAIISGRGSGGSGGSGGKTVLKQELITSNTEWTVPNVINNTVEVRIFGGGGGGGHYDARGYEYGGGGGGGNMNHAILDIMVPGARIPISIGEGGRCANMGIGDGSNGGTTSFGGYLSATGGGGGKGINSSGGNGGTGGGGGYMGNGGNGFYGGGGGGGCNNNGGTGGTYGGGGGGGYGNSGVIKKGGLKGTYGGNGGNSGWYNIFYDESDWANAQNGENGINTSTYNNLSKDSNGHYINGYGIGGKTNNSYAFYMGGGGGGGYGGNGGNTDTGFYGGGGGGGGYGGNGGSARLNNCGGGGGGGYGDNGKDGVSLNKNTLYGCGGGGGGYRGGYGAGGNGIYNLSLIYKTNAFNGNAGCCILWYYIKQES